MEKIVIPVIHGDGIGPEVIGSAQRVVETLCKKYNIEVVWIPLTVGQQSIDLGFEALPQGTVDIIRTHKVALKGPTGTPSGKGHRSVNVDLRQELDLYANVRPVKYFPKIGRAHV